MLRAWTAQYLSSMCFPDQSSSPTASSLTTLAARIWRLKLEMVLHYLYFSFSGIQLRINILSQLLYLLHISYLISNQ